MGTFQTYNFHQQAFSDEKAFLNNKELMTKVRMLSQDYKTFIESSIFNHNKNMLEGFKKLELESLLFLERKLSPKRKMFPSIKLKLKKCLAI